VLARFTKEEDRMQISSGLQKHVDQQIEKLRAAGLWDLLEDAEREFMQTGPFETTMRHRIDAGWLAESIMCLFWALGRRVEILAYDQEADPKSNWPHKGETARDLIQEAVFRPEAEIDRQRDLAELWHWRCRTQTLLASKKIPDALPDGTSMAEVIRRAADKAAEWNVHAQPIESDFPVFGKPFRNVSEEELSRLTSIAMERHKAFNWLCGYAPGNRWSETPTDT
jgi:hypothetical protein